MATYPNDTKDFTFDSTNNTTCSSPSAVLMPAVSYDRTILHVVANNANKNTNRADVHLYSGGQGIPNQFFDNEKEGYVSTDTWHLAPANYPITCDKNGGIGDHVFFRILYTDYNLASVSVPTVSVSINGGASIVGSFTYGELVITFFLFLGLCGGLLKAILDRHSGKKARDTMSIYYD